MGWQIYECPAGRPLRFAGYGVPAWCDHPLCNEVIDRGVSHICGGVNTNGEGRNCRLHFCEKHLHATRDFGNSCEQCHPRLKNPFVPKPDHPDWVRHVLTDPSWKEWLALHPEYIEEHAAVRQTMYAEHIYRYLEGLHEKPGSYEFLGEESGFILDALPQIFPEMKINESDDNE